MGISREPTPLIDHLYLAQYLNRVTGARVFTPWNVGVVPQVDVDELRMYARLKKDIDGN